EGEEVSYDHGTMQRIKTLKLIEGDGGIYAIEVARQLGSVCLLHIPTSGMITLCLPRGGIASSRD
ncbi:MAG: hypothetical protein SGPRY_014561, partial [Prymnesium sp.]